MSDIKVDIGQYRLIDKGALKATFSLVIYPMGQKILKCKYFVKGDNKWFAFPDFEAKKDGQEKPDYIPYVSYLNKDYLAQLQIAVLTALRDAKPKESSGQTTTQNRQAAPLQNDTSALWF
jgi:hypothetical protein